MMSKAIQQILQEELTQVNIYIERLLQQQEPTILQLIQHLLQQPGKQVRPYLVLLTAGMLGGKINERTRRGAALISLLHHASLIHDDVVDQSIYRRYQPTVNAKWGNKIAVLWGDYILARILKASVETQDDGYLATLAAAAQAMAEGEIIQLQQAKDLAYSEDMYLNIIKKKTASLIAASCAIGAIAVAASQEAVEIMHRVGEYLGMAFQLADDLADFHPKAAMGKGIFMDLQAQQLTLPLIYSLQQVGLPEAQEILKLVKKIPEESSALQAILDFVYKSGGIEYTQQKLSCYYQQATDLLTVYLPSSEYKEAFLSFIEQLIPPDYMVSKISIH